MVGKRHPDAAETLTQTMMNRPPHPKEPIVLHPSDPELHQPLAVRDGQSAPVTCATCGCRLSATGDAWFHFNPLGGRDARGCRIACADAAHDVSGRPISLTI